MSLLGMWYLCQRSYDQHECPAVAWALDKDLSVKLKQIKFLTCPYVNASFTPSSTVRSLICYGVERVTGEIIKC